MKKFFHFLIFFFLIHFLSNSYNIYANDHIDFEAATEEISNIINTKYIYNTNVNTLTNGALKGMIETLDPYSSFMTADEYKDFKDMATGEFGGIGAELQKSVTEPYVKVISVMKDSSAFNAKIEPDDKITHINDEIVGNQNIIQIVRKIRGKIGTKVKLKLIKANGINQDIILTRIEVKKDTVFSKILSNHIGYIEIQAFNNQTYNDFLKNIKNLYSRNINALIIDVRHNPGGLLESAVNIANLFVKKDDNIVTVKGKTGEILYKYKGVNAKKTFDVVPIVVLINKGSASAAEILTAALQENGIATVMGEKSYGKATVQEVIEMENIPGAAVKLTIAQYYTPKDHMIDKKGIIPDIEVRNILKENDDVLKKAIEILS